MKKGNHSYLRYAALTALVLLSSFCIGSAELYKTIGEVEAMPWFLSIEGGAYSYTLSFPPFTNIKSKAQYFDENVPLEGCRYSVSYKDGTAQSGVKSIPAAYSSKGAYYFAAPYHKYFPKKPANYISFESDFAPGRIDRSVLSIVMPTSWADTEIKLNGKTIEKIEGYKARIDSHRRVLEVPATKLKLGSLNSLQALISLSNYTDDYYAEFDGKPLIVKAKESKLSKYCRSYEISYRRTALYKQKIYKSSLTPFSVVENYGERIIISGLTGSERRHKRLLLFGDENISKGLSGGSSTVYDIEKDGGLKENYAVLYAASESGNDFPMLLVWNKPLKKLYRSAAGELSMFFESSDGKCAVSLLPLANSAEGMSAKQSKNFEKDFPLYYKAKAEEISRMAFVMPYDLEDGMKIFDPMKFKFRRFKNEGGDSYRLYAPYTKNIPADKYKINTLVIAGETYRYAVIH